MQTHSVDPIYAMRYFCVHINGFELIFRKSSYSNVKTQECSRKSLHKNFDHIANGGNYKIKICYNCRCSLLLIIIHLFFKYLTVALCNAKNGTQQQ